MTANDSSPILLYDGVCGFCDGFVQFVLARDRRGDMRFAPLEGAFARALLARHPSLSGVDSLVLVHPASGHGEERVFLRSSAAIEVAEYLGGIWRAASLLRLIPKPWRDWGYDRFAEHRYQWFGRRDQCRVPSAESRARFLE